MALNRVKLGKTVFFMKHFASVFSLILLLKSLIWNEITFSLSNMLSLAEQVGNALMKSISKKICQYIFFYPIYHTLM